MVEIFDFPDPYKFEKRDLEDLCIFYLQLLQTGLRYTVCQCAQISVTLLEIRAESLKELKICLKPNSLKTISKNVWSDSFILLGSVKTILVTFLEKKISPCPLPLSTLPAHNLIKQKKVNKLC
jgi:hypothetical protein